MNVWLWFRGITKPAIRRLARRGGVKRISGLIYEASVDVRKMDPRAYIGCSTLCRRPVVCSRSSLRLVVALTVV